MDVGQIAPRRLADTIVEQLETMILEGTLQPGERLPPERVLSEQFGVSRPSLREAIQRLTAKGLLISRQGGGNYVTESLGGSFSDPLIPLLETGQTHNGICWNFAAHWRRTAPITQPCERQRSTGLT